MLDFILLATGLLDGDDFNDGVVDSRWERMCNTEFPLKEEDGWLKIEGTPTGKHTLICHVGAMTKAPYPNADNVVMVGRYMFPLWQCGEWDEVGYYEFHLCNVQPDINFSVQIIPNCPLAFDTIDLKIDYRDNIATGYIDGEVWSGPREVHLPDNKRIELKMPLVPYGVDAALHVDYVYLYKHPLDYPATFLFPEAQDITLTYNGMTVDASDPVYLSAGIEYPVDATLTVDGESAELSLFPGDTYSAPIGGCQ